jgi:hypothetical protein
MPAWPPWPVVILAWALVSMKLSKNASTGTKPTNHPELDPSQVRMGAVKIEVDINTYEEPFQAFIAPTTEAIYPDEILRPGGILEEIMDYTEESSPASIRLFALGTAITGLGSIAGMKVQTETGLKTNMYVASIGYSGTGKDAGSKAMPRLLQHTDAKRMLGPTEIASAPGFLKHLTIPGNQCAMFSFDECGMLLKNLQQPTSPNADLPRMLTKMFSSAGMSEAKAYADSKNSFFLSWHHVSVYGCSTPQAFWSALQESDTVNGFLARWLIFDSRAEAPVPKKKINNKIPKRLVKKLLEIWNIVPLHNSSVKDLGNLASVDDKQVAPQPHIIEKTPEASAIFDKFSFKYHKLKNSCRENSAVSSIYARVAEHAHKLALIHAVSIHGKNIIKKKVDVDSVEWAMKVAEACAKATIEGMRDSISHNEWHALEQKVVRLIKAKATPQKPGVTYREICNHIHQNKKQIVDLLDSLLHAGVIFQQKYKPNRGPETSIFCLRSDHQNCQNTESEEV